MDIDADLDGGSIEVVSADDPGAIELALRPDNASDYSQWFHFRLTGAAGTPCSLRIGNAGESSWPDAWESYRACASYDGESWFRVPTRFEDGALTVSHTPEQDAVFYSYFAAYPFERHQKLVHRAGRSKRARVTRLGESLEGKPMSVVTLGDEGKDDLRIWLIGRQHPGETMASWFMEGLIPRLLDHHDPIVQQILGRAVFYIVPNMNPDGGAKGNHRTNAAGRDLNREWLDPSMEASPEVFLVRQAMLESGVDLFLDIHGDERRPYCFAAGCEGNPDYSERIQRLEEIFEQSLLAIDGDFQREVGYEHDPPGEANLKMAGNYVGEQFDCLSLTLEMPFKDNANHPDEVAGWSPDRCRHFGRSTVESVLFSLDSLR